MVQTRAPFEQGPYLLMAVFCEKVLQERDGVLSVIRVIDRFTQTALGPDAPETMPAFSYNLNAVINLKSGSARGTVTIQIEPELPSGLRLPRVSMSALMEGEDRGHNFLLNIPTTFTEPGLYWFSVYLDDQLLTRMPFRVVYTRISQAQGRLSA